VNGANDGNQDLAVSGGARVRCDGAAEWGDQVISCGASKCIPTGPDRV
jgi:hypothetical protein